MVWFNKTQKQIYLCIQKYHGCSEMACKSWEEKLTRHRKLMLVCNYLARKSSCHRESYHNWHKTPLKQSNFPSNCVACGLTEVEKKKIICQIENFCLNNMLVYIMQLLSPKVITDNLHNIIKLNSNYSTSLLLVS